MTISTTLQFALASGGIGVLYALATVAWVFRQSPGGDKLRSIADAIKAGGHSFLRRECLAAALLAIACALPLSNFLGPWIGNGFIVGALAAALAGYIGLAVAAKAGAGAAEAAKDGLPAAWALAFKGGSAVGLASASLALLGVAAYYALARSAVPADEAFRALLGLGLGGSLTGAFTRIAGGIYAKAARLGGEDIAENDPRNPALIASAACGNIDRGAGVAADLYETFTLALLAAMLLAKTVFGADSPWIEFPLLAGGVSIAAAIAGGLFTRLGRRKRVLGALYRGLFLAGVLADVLAGGAFYYVSWEFLDLPGLEPVFDRASLFATLFIGLVLTGFIVLITEHYTSARFKPVKRVAAAAAGGPAGNLVAGSKSTLLPVLAAAAAVGGAYYLGGGFDGNPWAGLFAVALAVVASLALASPVLAFNSYAAIADNANTIAELAELYERRHSVTAPLAAVGGTTQAVAKGYAIVTAALAAFALFAEYSIGFTVSASFSLSSPAVLAGLFIGGLLPYWLAARVLNAVAAAASRAAEEVGRQLQLPGAAEGAAAPQYARVADLLGKSAVGQTLVPVLALAAAPAAVGLLAGKEALGGLLIGALLTGRLQSIAMAGSGGAWDNAKRYIEDGMHGGKRSPAHAAASVGDTLGDACKDAASPALTALFKLVNIVALLAMPLAV